MLAWVLGFESMACFYLVFIFQHVTITISKYVPSLINLCYQRLTWLQKLKGHKINYNKRLSRFISACLIHRIQIRILWFKYRITGSHVKKHVWYAIFKWKLKSQLEFYVGSMPNLSSVICLFLNLIWTKFMWVPVSYRYWAHTFLLSPIFSLSSISFSASLSCSRLITEPVHRPFFSLRRLCFSLHVALIGQTQDRLVATMAGFITATTTTGSDTRLLAVRSRLLWMGLWRQRLVEVWVGYGFFCR